MQAACPPKKMLLARGATRCSLGGGVAGGRLVAVMASRPTAARAPVAARAAADGESAAAGVSTATTTATTTATNNNNTTSTYVDDQIGLATVFADMPSPPASPWPQAADRAGGSSSSSSGPYSDAPSSLPSPSSTREFSFSPAAAAASASERPPARLLPVNYAPETKYTVDSPADADAARFPRLHPSVDFWRTFRTSMPLRTGGGGTNGSNGNNNSNNSSSSLEEARAVLRDLAATSPLEDSTSAAYWAYHLGRTGFFLGASFAGALAHHLVATAEAASSNETQRTTPLQNLTSAGAREVTNRLAEAVALYRQDLAEVKKGSYALPYDMTTLDPTKNAQYNPLTVAGRTLAFVREAVETLDRRVKRADTSNWLSAPSFFPGYYSDNTFHYQTGGWLTTRSSRAYEFSTESLFFGRQDAMQRAALVPLASWADRQAGIGAGGEGLRLLEVAAGTGRFHTFIRDNYPRAASTVSDLSPFYLERARENMRAWSRIRGRGGGARGGSGSDADGRGADDAEFLMCAAESVPKPDASYDVIACVYLFHELPEEARVACAKEWYRLLRPGGLVVLTDSVQIGDREGWNETIGAFGDFNEPHYRNYIACDMGALFEDAGFEPAMKVTASASKVWSFVKPGGGDDA